ncbi:Fc.00g032940.m01.CDS01 [Cosmosporella sp. VM-42]
MAGLGPRNTSSGSRDNADDAVSPTTITDDDVRPDNGYDYGSFPSYEREEDAPVQPKPTKSSTRALAPDLLRGFLMLAMALDHNALALNTWQHGTGRESESDGTVIEQWNRPVAYVVRTITHLCGTGFTFLLGMGIIYLGRSRSRLGWTSWRLAKYFAVRGIVLSLVSVVLGVVLTGGKVWFMNVVLVSLGVDYFLAGLLWLAINKTEPLLARFISKWLPQKLEEDDVEEPLISSGRETPRHNPETATTISWHIHNVILLILGFVAIWWNIWLSATHGHCEIQNDGSTTLSAWAETTPEDPNRLPSGTTPHPILGIWFWPVMTEHVMSGFPPMAWLSFAILGLLYGRIVIARPRTQQTMALGHSFAGLLFFIFFVLTRVLQFGNLSQGCLQTPEHEKHPGRNPYLTSPQSFFYIIKYPPDVAFWAFTMAGNLFLLAIFGAIPTHISKRFSLLLDFGTAALFFYVAHLFVVFILGSLIVKWFGHDVGLPNPMNPDITQGVDNIFAYFAAWALAMLILWPMTRWYSRFKSTKSADSIWRFF